MFLHLTGKGDINILFFQLNVFIPPYLDHLHLDWISSCQIWLLKDMKFYIFLIINKSHQKTKRAVNILTNKY